MVTKHTTRARTGDTGVSKANAGGTKASAGRQRYMQRIRAFPLRPLRSDSDLDAAIVVLDRLQASLDTLTAEELDYLECLSHEIERYEAENVPMPAVSGPDLIRHLMDERDATLSQVAEATDIAVSTLSSVLKGKRKLNLRHVKPLATYFDVEPAVFLD